MSNGAVLGESQTDDGVRGRSHDKDHSGVAGLNDGGIGVFGDSDGNDGVQGKSRNKDHAGVSGINNAGGFGVFGKGRIAGSFQGDVEITGNLTMLNGGDIRLADFSEDFDVSAEEEIEPGTVVVLDHEGSVQKS